MSLRQSFFWPVEKWPWVIFVLLPFILTSPKVLFSAEWAETPTVSTQPIGSPFFRHLAVEMNQDLKELHKFEKAGYGRVEIITLLLLSQSTGLKLEEYANLRIKDRKSLRQLTADAKLDYGTIHQQARNLKEKIEAMGANNLPPPIFAEPSPTPTPKPKKNRKN